MHAVLIEAGGNVPLPRVGGALSHAVGSIRNLPRHCQPVYSTEAMIRIILSLIILRVIILSHIILPPSFFPSWPRSSRGLLSSPPLALLDHFGQIHNGTYLNRSKSELKAWLL